VRASRPRYDVERMKQSSEPSVAPARARALARSAPRRLASAALLALAAVGAVSCATPEGLDGVASVRARKASGLELTPCSVPKSATEAYCGVYHVFEDREARTGRTLPLKIVVLPAITDTPAPDPIFVLAGGPGQGAASGVTTDIVEYFRPMRSERDVVFVDQRGTGESNRLGCRLTPPGPAAQSRFTDLLPPDMIRACRASLEKIADLRLYTTPIAMDDLDEVRTALGYGAINVYGVSYGSLAAMQYLRQHSTSVRSMVLLGVGTPAQKLPLQFAAAAQSSLDRLIADCAADPACHAAFPDPKADLETVLGQFDAGPVSFELPAASGKASERVSMSRAVFAERLRLMLYELRRARHVPFVLHRAAAGDWAPFARRTSPALTGNPPSFGIGMYLTVTCSESVATITEDDIVRESRGSFVGEDRTRIHVRACQEWPRGSIPADFYAPVTSRVPVLMLSGELDAATPAHFGTTVARSLPNSRQVLIRNVSHDYFNDCLRDLVAEFIAAGTARGLDIRCVRTLRRPPFATE